MGILGRGVLPNNVDDIEKMLMDYGIKV